VAALASFEATDELDAVKAGYARNRALLLDELPRIGLSEMHPVDGAFYIYADIARFTNDSIGFCRRMLDEAGVAATPGADFDPVEGAHYLRLSFADRRSIAARRCDASRPGCAERAATSRRARLALDHQPARFGRSCRLGSDDGDAARARARAREPRGRAPPLGAVRPHSRNPLATAPPSKRGA
jgi:hypothetical protein